MITSPSANGHDAGRLMVGLAGRGILESRTPWMHEQEADAQGLRLVYSLFDFTAQGWADGQLGALLDAAQLLGFAGLNITFPFKQAVIPLLDELDDAARSVGAVNTVAFREGRRIGCNTDITGFAESFRAGLPDAARGEVLQLGCGGAGSATAHAMLGLLGVERLLLYDTDAARAGLLREQLALAHGADRVALVTDIAASARAADGIVNATPMGMAKFPGLPLPADLLEARHFVADIVYFPLETELLAAARRRGCRTLDGSGMAVQQAADAFAIFTRKVADTARMREAFTRFASAKVEAAA